MENTNTTTEFVDIASRPNHLKLVSLTVDAFAGLDYSDKSLVIVFPEGENIAEFSGDQGVGKTSLANALSTLMGGDEPKNAVNADKLTKGAELEFVDNGTKYISKLTKSAYTLRQITDVPGAKKAVATVSSPKTVLSNIVGPLGVSPDFLKGKSKGEDQIAWIKSMVSQNTDLAAQEQEYKNLYDISYKKRTQINKDIQELRGKISDSALYVWDNENKVFVESANYQSSVEIEAAAPKDRTELDEKFKAAEKKNSEYNNGKSRLLDLNNKLSNHQSKIKSIEDEILNLQAQLATEKTKLAETEESITKGNEYVKEREAAEQEYQVARKEVMDYGNIETLRRLISDSKINLQDHAKAESAKRELEDIMTTCELELKNLAQKYTPNIEGLEVVVANIDSARPEGVYYKGTNIAHLCESELWDLCLQVWKHTGIRIVFIENSSSLGSEAIQRINWFAANGGYVFVTTMQRGYKELKVSFHKELK